MLLVILGAGASFDSVGPTPPQLHRFRLPQKLALSDMNTLRLGG